MRLSSHDHAVIPSLAASQTSEPRSLITHAPISCFQCRPQSSLRTLTILTPLSFFDSVLTCSKSPVYIRGRMTRPYPVLSRACPVEPHGQARGTSDSAPLWGDIPAKSWCIHPQPRPWPSAAGVGFPKRAAPSGIGDIHDFYHRNPLNVKKLVQNKPLYNR